MVPGKNFIPTSTCNPTNVAGDYSVVNRVSSKLLTFVFVLFFFKAFLPGPSLLAGAAKPAAFVALPSSKLPFASVAPGNSEQQPVAVLFERGEAALKAGNLVAAEADFRRVLALDPKSVGAYANLGVVYMRKKQWPEAIALLRKAERLAPTVPGIRLNIGLAYYRQSNFQAAIPPFRSVVREQPDSLQARYLLGLCYFFTNEYTPAVQILEPLWPQESANLNFLYVLGTAARKANQPELEQRAITRLVEVGNDSAELHLLMGKALINRQDYDKAIPELERAAQLDPKLPFVHFNLGIAYLQKQDYPRAELEFKKDIALEPDLAFNYDQLGAVYLYTQQDKEAEERFRQALQRDPRLTSSYLGLAKIYQRQGKFSDALIALNKAGHFEPGSSNIHYLKGQVLLRLGHQQEAKAELAEATRILNAERGQRQKELSGESIPQPEVQGPE